MILRGYYATAVQSGHTSSDRVTLPMKSRKICHDNEIVCVSWLEPESTSSRPRPRVLNTHSRARGMRTSRERGARQSNRRRERENQAFPAIPRRAAARGRVWRVYKDLAKLLQIKDSIYGLKKDLLTKNAKLVKFVEDTRERVLDAALDAEEQKKMAEKSVLWILEAAKRQESLEEEAEKIKKEIERLGNIK